MTTSCPSDDQLLAVAMDDPGADAARLHAQSCAACTERLVRLRGEVSALNAFATGELAALTGTGLTPRGDSLPSRPQQSTVSLAAVSAQAVAEPPERVGRYVVLGPL